MKREARITRTTAETDIKLLFKVDGNGKPKVNTGNGFFDHMLTLFTRHGMFGLQVDCKGDTEVDLHHSVEDIGICLGQAVAKALDRRRGIARFGSALVPMDESLARVCCDMCGRSTLVYDVALVDRIINGFECDLVYDFLKSLTDNGGITLHVDLLRGRNSHHSLEAVFKALGQAMSQACAIDRRAGGEIPSTKGVL